MVADYLKNNKEKRVLTRSDLKEKNHLLVKLAHERCFIMMASHSINKSLSRFILSSPFLNTLLMERENETRFDVAYYNILLSPTYPRSFCFILSIGYLLKDRLNFTNVSIPLCYPNIFFVDHMLYKHKEISYSVNKFKLF